MDRGSRKKTSIITASSFIFWQYAQRLTALFTFCGSWSGTKIVPPSQCSLGAYVKNQRITLQKPETKKQKPRMRL